MDINYVLYKPYSTLENPALIIIFWCPFSHTLPFTWSQSIDKLCWNWTKKSLLKRKMTTITSLNRLNYERTIKYYPNFHCLSLAATCFFLCFDEYFDKKFEFSRQNFAWFVYKTTMTLQVLKKKWLNIKKCCQAIKTTLKNWKFIPLSWREWCH